MDNAQFISLFIAILGLEAVIILNRKFPALRKRYLSGGFFLAHVATFYAVLLTVGKQPDVFRYTDWSQILRLHVIIYIAGDFLQELRTLWSGGLK